MLRQLHKEKDTYGYHPHCKSKLNIIKNELKRVDNTVTSVHLEKNSIKADGAVVVAEALKVNTTVTSFDFRLIPTGDEGARTFAERLNINSKITVEEVEVDPPDCFQHSIQLSKHQTCIFLSLGF
ncbi:hypothetical protein GEMRC1_000927 [Eukaryota sp. GEM-RC1]